VGVGSSANDQNPISQRFATTSLTKTNQLSVQAPRISIRKKVRPRLQG